MQRPSVDDTNQLLIRSTREQCVARGIPFRVFDPKHTLKANLTEHCFRTHIIIITYPATYAVGIGVNTVPRTLTRRACAVRVTSLNVCLTNGPYDSH